MAGINKEDIPKAIMAAQAALDAKTAVAVLRSNDVNRDDYGRMLRALVVNIDAATTTVTANLPIRVDEADIPKLLAAQNARITAMP